MQVQPNFPHMFCVKTYMGGRQGYYLMRWSVGNIENNQNVHILKGANHYQRFFNIQSVPLAEQNNTWHTIQTRKNSGNVVRPIRWAFTSERLKEDDRIIPVLNISPMSALPSMKMVNFIPIIVNTPAVPVPVAEVPVPVAEVPVPVPAVPQIQTKKYTIDTIPQHIVRALLRDAVMQEEICPITSTEIDIANGAVTSCFHLFEKNAIMKWLLMPGSRDKCPICNCPCNSYTLDSTNSS